MIVTNLAGKFYCKYAKGSGVGNFKVLLGLKIKHANAITDTNLSVEVGYWEYPNVESISGKGFERLV